MMVTDFIHHSQRRLIEQEKKAKDEDQEEDIRKKPRQRQETAATEQDTQSEVQDNVDRLQSMINTFIDAESNYAVMANVVDISLLPALKDDIYSQNSIWNHVNFTPDSKRYMRLVRNSTHPACNDLLAAIHRIFTDCTIHLKVIHSKPGDKPQREHYDIIDSYVNITPKDRRKYHYSIIVAICNGTKFYVEQTLIHIPVGSMIIFRGDTPHAGASYKRHNHRFFISISHELFPVHKSVGLATDK
jgi:hypothetical protein